jgi:hypothetical protein
MTFLFGWLRFSHRNQTKDLRAFRVFCFVPRFKSRFFKHDLLDGVQTIMTLWEWSELFLKNGFRLASVSPQSLKRVWQIETKSNEGDFSWYTGAEAMRFCFYTKIHRDKEAKLYFRDFAERHTARVRGGSRLARPPGIHKLKAKSLAGISGSRGSR